MSENNETVLPAALSPVFRMPEMTDEMRDAILKAWKECTFVSSGAHPRLETVDPLADVVAQVAALPREGLAFVVLTPTADGVVEDAIKPQGPIAFLSQRIRAANPNAHLLVLPQGWSFRTMDRAQAREFVSNMLAFVSDDELAEHGLKHVEENAAPPPADPRHPLLPGDVFERLLALDPPVGAVRIKTVYANDRAGDAPCMTVRTASRVPEQVQDELAACMPPHVRLVFKDNDYSRVARVPSRANSSKETAGG